MIKTFKQVISWFDRIAERTVTDKSQLRKAIILMRGSLLTGLFMLNYLVVSLLIDFKVGIAIMPIEAALFLSLPILFYLRVNQKIIGHLFITIGWAFGIGLVVYSGGFYSPVMPWLTLLPICAILFLGRREAWIWAFILLATLLVMAGYWYNVGEYVKDYNTNTDIFFYTNCYSGLIFIYLMLSLIFEIRLTKAYQEVENQNMALAEEKKKSDDLLLNILPSEIADELKLHGKSKAQSFDQVTVLFSDFVNFTGISELMSPTELVEEIHKNFTVFDSIMEKHGIEKIKTIGDAYMAVCGLPDEKPDHAERCIRAAFEIQSYVENSNSKFKIRIGINSGPVVAGIVGVKKFAYDIWGDTVNTANRMESNGEDGKINISGSTYELIKNKFKCTHRGKISAKGKGEIDMYFVEHGINDTLPL